MTKCNDSRLAACTGTTVCTAPAWPIKMLLQKPFLASNAPAEAASPCRGETPAARFAQGLVQDPHGSLAPPAPPGFILCFMGRKEEDGISHWWEGGMSTGKCSGLRVQCLDFEFLCIVHLFTLEFAIKSCVQLGFILSLGCPIVLLPSRCS